VIVGSLLLILVAVALLVLGLANGSSVLLIGSIAASLLAAVALVVGARQAAAARVGAADPDDDPGLRPDDEGGDRPRSRWSAAGSGEPRRPAHTEPFEVTIPSQHVPGAATTDSTRRRQPAGASAMAPGTRAGGDAGPAADGSPPDEPAPQHVPAADAARVARMDTDVLVVDGRPRYHVPGCRHLLGRDSEPVPVREAVELGFTPCGGCEPDSALLADARRG
jgi:hypothetical protein